MDQKFRSINHQSSSSSLNHFDFRDFSTRILRSRYTCDTRLKKLVLAMSNNSSANAHCGIMIFPRRVIACDLLTVGSRKIALLCPPSI